MLVDSGADISLLKLNCTNDDAEIFPQITVEIKGVTENTVKTYGMCIGTLTLPDGIIFKHKFYIVPENFPINSNGLLGNDFYLPTAATYFIQTLL